MKPGIYNYQPLTAGNTLDAVRFQIKVNGANPTAHLTTAVAKFYQNGSVTLTPSVTVISTTTWTFDVGPVAGSSTAIAGGEHTLNITTTDADGRIRDYVAGTLTILPKGGNL